MVDLIKVNYMEKIMTLQNRDYSENYYTDPKVTHPSIKIDVPIPHEWETISYSNDLCPSFTHKGLQIFVCDEENKKLEQLHFKYSVIRDEDYGYAHTDLLLTDDWNEVLEFVKNYGGKNANKKPFIIKDLMDLQDYLVKQNGDDFEPIDSWCHDRLYEYLDQKKLKKDMVKKFICIDKVKKELYAYNKKGNTDIQFKAHMVKNHPQDTCLNFLSFNDAWKLFDEVTS